MGTAAAAMYAMYSAAAYTGTTEAAAAAAAATAATTSGGYTCTSPYCYASYCHLCLPPDCRVNAATAATHHHHQLPYYPQPPPVYNKLSNVHTKLSQIDNSKVDEGKRS